jgi:hypothetical protein
LNGVSVTGASDSGPRAVNAIDEPRLVITYDRNEKVELVEVAYGRGAGRQVPASFVQWSRCAWPSLRKSDSLRHCGFRSQQAIHQPVSPRAELEVQLASPAFQGETRTLECAPFGQVLRIGHGLQPVGGREAE